MAARSASRAFTCWLSCNAAMFEGMGHEVLRERHGIFLPCASSPDLRSVAAISSGITSGIFGVAHRDTKTAEWRAFVLAANTEGNFAWRIQQARRFDHREMRFVHFGVHAPAALQLVSGPDHEIEFGLFGFEVGGDAGEIDFLIGRRALASKKE